MRNLLLLSSVLLFSCSQPKVDTKAEGEKVMQASKEWSQAASSGDVEKTLTYWADNAIVMSSNHPPLTGKQEIRKMVEESMKIPGFNISWEPKSVEVSESGDMAYLLEDAQVSVTDSTGKPVTSNYKTVTIWRKQSDGSWKNVVDVSTPLQNK